MRASADPAVPPSKDFLRGAALLVGGSAVGRVAILAGTLYAAARLAPAHFGAIVLVQTTTVTLAAVGGLGLAVAVARRVADALTSSTAAVGEVIAVSLVLTSGLGAALACALASTAPWVARDLFNQPAIITPLRVGAALVLLSTLAGQVVASLNALGQNRASAIVTAIRGVVQGTGLLVGVRAGGALGGIAGLAAGELAGALIGLVALRHVLAGRTPSRRTAWRRTGLDLLRTGMPVLAAGLAVQPAFWLGQVLLTRDGGGLAAAGVFGVALRWNNVAMFVPAAIAPLAIPRLARAFARADRVTLGAVFRVNLLVTGIAASAAAGFIAVAATWLAEMQPGQVPAAPAAIIIMAAVAIPMTLNNALTQLALSTGRIRAAVVSDVVLGIVLVGTALLTARSGPRGLGFAYLVAYLASCAALVETVRRVLQTDSPADKAGTNG